MKLFTLLILFFSLTIFSGHLQSQINPFEIEGRIDSTELVKMQDVQSIGSEFQEVLKLAQPEEDRDLVNPFEVNHVPLLPSINKNRQNREVQRLNRSRFISQTYIMWILLVCVIVFALITAQHRQYVRELFSSLLNNNAFNNLRRKSGGITNIYGILLYLNFTVSLTIFIILSVSSTELYVFGYLLLSIVLVYIIKHMCLAISAYILPQDDLIKRYSFSIGSIHLVLGIVLLPLNILMYFDSSTGLGMWSWIGTVIIVLSLVLRLLKGLFFSSKVVASYPFQFFIYLCAFEIMPWLVIFRLLNNIGILN